MAYGLKVFNENGTVEIFGYGVAGTHFIARATLTLADGASQTVTAEGMTSTNTSTITVGFETDVDITITRGTNQVTFANSTGGSVTFTYVLLRA